MKVGDKVVIFNKSLRYTSKASITQIIENKVYGVVASIKSGSYGEALDITFKDSLKINHTGYDHVIEASNCKLVTDLKEAEKRNTLFNKKRVVLSKSMRDGFKMFEKLGNRRRIITTKDIESSISKKLNYNFVEVGTIDAEKGFNPSSFLSKQQCCSFTKTKQDLRVYIPKIWVNTLGYSEINILTYLEFLKKCEINFDYTYEGLKELPISAPLSVPLNSLEDDKFFYEMGNSADVKTIYRIVPKKEEFYSIVIRRGNSSMETYLKFICVRYLYNNQYWSIPATAIQIKDALKDKITHLQAFLMAHMRYDYYEYYSLIFKGMIVNIFQDPSYFLGKLEDGNDMNNSFEYKKNAPNSARRNIQTLLEEQRYQEALTILQSYK